MTDVFLPYGDSGFHLTMDTRFELIVPPKAAATPPVEHLIESPPLAELGAGRRVLIIVSDLTRPTGARDFVPLLLERLERAASIRFLFATGIHRPLADEDKAVIVGEDVSREYPMLDHEPEANNVHVGDTSRGNRVEVSRHVLEDDLVVLTGSIGFHYFAGFSGGRKSLLPGVASKSSIEFNHLLVLNPESTGRHPEVRVANMAGNPVHEDMVEGARLVGRDLFTYNTILDPEMRIQKTYCGHWEEAHRQGAEDYLRSHSVPIEGRRPLGIVSCGGFPRDINMIQAHKALEFAQYSVEPGGTIILLAECREGTGHLSFFPWFRYQSLEEFESQLRAHYEVYGQTAYSLLSKAQRFRVICVSSLESDIVRSMGMEPAADLETALSMLDPSTAGAQGFVMPFGAQVLPYDESLSGVPG